MNFKPLYKLNKNGKWQQYIIKVVEKDSKVFIQKSSGLISGKIRINYEEIKKVKRKETLLEQAKFIGERIWKNKKQNDLYREDMIVSSKETFVISRDFRPQLAKTFHYEKTKLKYPIIAQKKYDGNRAILYRNEQGNIVMESRNGHQYLEESVFFITEEYKELPYNIILDGELFIPGLSFQELQSIVRLKKSPVTDKTNEFKKLKFYTFDLIDLDNHALKFDQAYLILTNIVKNKKNTILVKNDIINCKEEIKPLHDKYVEEGYEGIMLRKKEKTYGINKRNSDLLKYKYFIDSEYKIIGLKIEINNGLELPMWKCITETGKEFTCRPIGSTEYKLNLLKKYEEYIGKYLTVKYQELSDDGIPRFGVGKSIREFL